MTLTSSRATATPLDTEQLEAELREAGPITGIDFKIRLTVPADIAAAVLHSETDPNAIPGMTLEEMRLIVEEYFQRQAQVMPKPDLDWIKSVVGEAYRSYIAATSTEIPAQPPADHPVEDVED